jgi:hypothetical protein
MRVKRNDIIRLVDAYNRNPENYNDQEARQIAIVARQMGLDFNREAKPLRKFLFDVADMGLLGLLPNKYRPTSRGEDVFGETRSDKIAGTLGTVLGLAPAIPFGIGAVQGARVLGPKAYVGAREGAKSFGKKAYSKIGDFAEEAGAYSQQSRNAFQSLKRGEGTSFFDFVMKRYNKGRVREGYTVNPEQMSLF